MVLPTLRLIRGRIKCDGRQGPQKPSFTRITPNSIKRARFDDYDSGVRKKTSRPGETRRGK